MCDSNAAPAQPIAVAVITCERNESRRALLEALDRQASFRDQMIVVDDATSIRSSLVPDRLASRWTPLRTWGSGAAAARNAAASVCERDWILFVDDDVIIPEGFLDDVRVLVAEAQFDVLTANVMSAPSCGEVGRLFDERYPLSRGMFTRTFVGTTGTHWTPNDVWRVGVGACMVWRLQALHEAGGFPPQLGQGRPLGGSEDLAAFRRALSRGRTIRYEGRLVVRHHSPATTRDLKAKMRGYALAEGALAGHVWRVERRPGMLLHLLADMARVPATCLVESTRLILCRRHLPPSAVAAFPFLAAAGFLGYLARNPRRGCGGG